MGDGPTRNDFGMKDPAAIAATVPRACPICEGNETSPHWSKGSLRVVQCRRCGMWFANPVPEEFVTGAFYDRLATPFYLSSDKLESDYAPVRFERELRLFRRFCPGGAVLDVGCSTGGFLHQLNARFPGAYALLGTDVAGPALDHAESRGVPVLRAGFLEHDFGERRFAAITLWAVLEHLAQPRAFLAKAAALLQPGGHLFVLVPNGQSLAVHLLGARYRYILPDHLNYFTARTLTACATIATGLPLVLLHSLHFNPVVLWQDWNHPEERVPDAKRAQLLRRTTAWKQNVLLRPVKWLYTGVERLLGAARLADNLVGVWLKS
jgi:2-polyprenyl-3-methyl-5-hydroxy-6-metoxy-1,4-benzoquinol methylase